NFGGSNGNGRQEMDGMLRDMSVTIMVINKVTRTMAITITALRNIGDMAITIIDSTSVHQVEKVIRIKNISHSLLFALRRLGKARHCGVTDIVLATMREYALRLRVVDMNQKKEHTMLEQLDKFYLHRYPHPFPQYIMKDKTRISTRMGT